MASWALFGSDQGGVLEFGEHAAAFGAVGDPAPRLEEDGHGVEPAITADAPGVCEVHARRVGRGGDDFREHAHRALDGVGMRSVPPHPVVAGCDGDGDRGAEHAGASSRDDLDVVVVRPDDDHQHAVVVTVERRGRGSPCGGQERIGVGVGQGVGRTRPGRVTAWSYFEYRRNSHQL